MKCSEASRGPLQTIQLLVVDILEDKSPNDLKTTLGMLKDQVNNIEVLEGLTPPAY